MLHHEFTRTARIWVLLLNRQTFSTALELTRTMRYGACKCGCAVMRTYTDKWDPNLTDRSERPVQMQSAQNFIQKYSLKPLTVHMGCMTIRNLTKVKRTEIHVLILLRCHIHSKQYALGRLDKHKVHYLSKQNGEVLCFINQ